MLEALELFYRHTEKIIGEPESLETTCGAFFIQTKSSSHINFEKIDSIVQRLHLFCSPEEDRLPTANDVKKIAALLKQKAQEHEAKYSLYLYIHPAKLNADHWTVKKAENVMNQFKVEIGLKERGKGRSKKNNDPENPFQSLEMSYMPKKDMLDVVRDMINERRMEFHKQIEELFNQSALKDKNGAPIVIDPWIGSSRSREYLKLGISAPEERDQNSFLARFISNSRERNIDTLALFTGEYGSGKTFIGRYLACKWESLFPVIEQGECDPASQPYIPILIELHRWVPLKGDFKDCLLNYIRRYYNIDLKNYSFFLRLCEDMHFVFIFDAIDQSWDALSNENARVDLQLLTNLSKKGYNRVIVTCRLSYFRKSFQEKLWENAERVSLKRFNRIQINKCMAETENQFASYCFDDSITLQPIHVFFLASLKNVNEINSQLKHGKIPYGNIIQEFWDESLQAARENHLLDPFPDYVVYMQSVKRQSAGMSCKDMLEEYSKWLMQNEHSISLMYENTGRALKNIKDTGSNELINKLRSLVLPENDTVISRSLKKVFAFVPGKDSGDDTHLEFRFKILLDYLAADWAFNDIAHDLDSEHFSLYSPVYSLGILGIETRASLLDKIAGLPDNPEKDKNSQITKLRFLEHLIERLDRSLERSGTNDVYTVTNLMNILCDMYRNRWIGVELNIKVKEQISDLSREDKLSDGNFKNIDFSSLDLSTLQMQASVFSGCNFSNVNFEQTNLKDSKFQHCILDDSGCVTAAQFYLDPKSEQTYIAYGTMQGMIKRFNPSKTRFQEAEDLYEFNNAILAIAKDDLALYASYEFGGVILSHLEEFRQSKDIPVQDIMAITPVELLGGDASQNTSSESKIEGLLLGTSAGDIHLYIWQDNDLHAKCRASIGENRTGWITAISKPKNTGTRGSFQFYVGTSQGEVYCYNLKQSTDEEERPQYLFEQDIHENVILESGGSRSVKRIIKTGDNKLYVTLQRDPVKTLASQEATCFEIGRNGPNVDIVRGAFHRQDYEFLNIKDVIVTEYGNLKFCYILYERDSVYGVRHANLNLGSQNVYEDLLLGIELDNTRPPVAFTEHRDARKDQYFCIANNQLMIYKRSAGSRIFINVLSRPVGINVSEAIVTRDKIGAQHIKIFEKGGARFSGES